MSHSSHSGSFLKQPVNHSLLLPLMLLLLASLIIQSSQFTLLQKSEVKLKSRGFVVLFMRFTEDELAKRSRRELQDIAIKNGIRANSKSSYIIKSILDSEGGLVDESVELHTALDKEVRFIASDREESPLARIDDILSEQGIRMQDLLRLQKRLGRKSELVASITGIDEGATVSSEYAENIAEIRRKPIILNAKSTDEQVIEISNEVVQAPEKAVKVPIGKVEVAERSETEVKTLKIPEVVPKSENRKLERREIKEVAPLSPLRKSEARKQKMGSKSFGAKVDISGVTLKTMLDALVADLGFDRLHAETGVRCFSSENKPSLTSSLKALRSPTMEWARKKVAYLYIKSRE